MAENAEARIAPIGISATMLVPSMLYALMDHPDSRTRDVPASRLLNFDPQTDSLFHGGVR